MYFSVKPMSRFFIGELNVDIDDLVYPEHGDSKGQRVHCFVQKVKVSAVIRTLKWAMGMPRSRQDARWDGFPVFGVRDLFPI